MSKIEQISSIISKYDPYNTDCTVNNISDEYHLEAADIVYNFDNGEINSILELRDCLNYVFGYYNDGGYNISNDMIDEIYKVLHP